MALAISASLVGVGDPQAAQIVVTGATIGDSYTVTGSDGSNVWTVRGADGLVTTATSFIVVDVAAPINVPVTYTVTHDADAAFVNATALTITFDHGNAVLTTMDGRQSAYFTWVNNGDPLETPMRSSLFYVPGRVGPVVRYDVPAADLGTLQLLTAADQTVALKAVLADQGGLCILRTDGAQMDFPAVQFLAVTNNQRALPGVGTERMWTLAYATIADPEPNTIVAAVTWDDFDDAWSTDTWTNFNSSWASGTWDGFDAFDWTTL